MYRCYWFLRFGWFFFFYYYYFILFSEGLGFKYIKCGSYLFYFVILRLLMVGCIVVGGNSFIRMEIFVYFYYIFWYLYYLKLGKWFLDYVIVFCGGMLYMFGCFLLCFLF